jgi:anti-anti-sigma regulatory factor
MASSIDPFTLTLSKPVTPDALSAFRDAVRRALDEGVRALLVDLDELGTLDSPTIAALILALREARERSAVLSLRASRQPILETLRITALDRVFTIVMPIAALAERRPPGPSPARRRKRSRFVASIALGLTVLAGASGNRAAAGMTPEPLDAIHNVIDNDAKIASYESTVSVDIHLRSFPYLSQHLDGTTYFKRPDNFEVVFQKVPPVAKGFDKLYSDIDDPTSWERRFDMSFEGERVVAGHRDLVIRLVQKVRGMIDHEDVAIDPATWRIDAMEWHYYNGGFIGMSQQYQNVGGYSVLATQHATIRIPYVHAAADATYSDYKTNVAIDDSVFTKAKH